MRTRAKPGTKTKAGINHERVLELGVRWGLKWVKTRDLRDVRYILRARFTSSHRPTCALYLGLRWCFRFSNVWNGSRLLNLLPDLPSSSMYIFLFFSLFLDSLSLVPLVIRSGRAYCNAVAITIEKRLRLQSTACLLPHFGADFA